MSECPVYVYICIYTGFFIVYKKENFLMSVKKSYSHRLFLVVVVLLLILVFLVLLVFICVLLGPCLGPCL